MLKSLFYKNLILIKKYYLWLLIGIVIMNFTLPPNMIVVYPLVLLLFQGICIRTIIGFDRESHFQKFIFATLGENKYIDSIYIFAVFNIVFSELILFLIMYNSNLSNELIGVFFSIQVLIYSFIWIIQIPLSYRKDISIFRVIEFMLLIFLIVLLFGLGGQYYGHIIYTMIKYKPDTWNEYLNLDFHFIHLVVVVLFSTLGLYISRLFLIKSIMWRRRGNR